MESKYNAFVFFNENLIPINKIIGVDQSIILFNQEEDNGVIRDYKIQLNEKVFLRRHGRMDLIEMKEAQLPFEIVDDLGNVLISSCDFDNGIVQSFINQLAMEADGGSVEWT